MVWHLAVDSNEWPRFKKLLWEHGISTELGFDFLLYTNAGTVAVERKKVPGDLLASVTDGRLAKECSAMREGADYRFLIPEGQVHYTADKYVVEKGITNRWTRTGVRNLLRSIRFVEGVDIEFSRNIPDTVSILQELQEYFDSGKHGSYRARPGIKSLDWPVSSYEERYLHWLQGLPNISLMRAKRILNVFKNPSEVFAATQEQWLGISGFGGKTGGGIYGFLHGNLIDK